MGMANDLDARGGTREERNKERNERREADSHKGTGGWGRGGETYRPHIMQTTQQLQRNFLLVAYR